jgi:hypothetical protein
MLLQRPNEKRFDIFRPPAAGFARKIERNTDESFDSAANQGRQSQDFGNESDKTEAGKPEKLRPKPEKSPFGGAISALEGSPACDARNRNAFHFRAKITRWTYPGRAEIDALGAWNLDWRCCRERPVSHVGSNLD